MRLMALKALVLGFAWLGPVFALPQVLRAQDNPLEYEQMLKQHQMKLARQFQSLASHSPTVGQDKFDVTYYDLGLSIDAPQSRITGVVEVRGRAKESLDLLELDLAQSMIVDSVKTESGLTNFDHTGDLLAITISPREPGEEFSITVYYQGLPANEGFGSFSFGTHNSLPLVATLSEPFFARTWWPCKDHPSDKADSADIRVTADSRLTVASNGTLIGITDHGNGTTTTHWHESYPIATYLISLAAADYEHYADTLHYGGGAMPVDFYILSGNVESLRANNAKVVDMLAFFSSVYGEYPFIREKYGHAQFLFGGGMEHQTCASIGVFHEWLLAHELAHQWWGDMITCGTWHDIWLNEGFARYSEALWLDYTNGPEAYHQYMNSLIRIDQQVYIEDTTEANQIFDRVVYDKGALVLHMLRYMVGDQTFFDIIQAYAESAHKYASATTTDFQSICEQVSGRELDNFFQQWVYQPAIPDYHFGYFAFETDSGWITDLQLLQVQTTYPLFQTDIDVRFLFADDSITFRLSNDQGKQNYRFVLPAEPQQCRLDPDNWIINQYTETDLVVQATVDSLPTAAVGVPYVAQLTAIGGQPPFSWSAYTISKPDEFRLSEGGLVTGTPVDTGTWEVGVRITDSSRPPREATSNVMLKIRSVRGNVNSDAGLTLSDLLFYVRFLYRAGPGPTDPAAADANCDGEIDIRDLVVLLNFLYQQGPLPCFGS